LPFTGVELFEAGSTKYISKIDAPSLIAAARGSLKTTDAEAYKVFLLGLLGGLRKGEMIYANGGWLTGKNHILRLEETEHLHLKTVDSAGEITIDPEVLAELREFMPQATPPFIVGSIVVFQRGKESITHIRMPRPKAKARYYRCEPVFKRLYSWLRNKGVTGNKPLHELRKEIGALIATSTAFLPPALSCGIQTSPLRRDTTRTIRRETYSDIEDHLREIRLKADSTVQWETGPERLEQENADLAGKEGDGFLQLWPIKSGHSN